MPLRPNVRVVTAIGRSCHLRRTGAIRRSRPVGTPGRTRHRRCRHCSAAHAGGTVWAPAASVVEPADGRRRHDVLRRALPATAVRRPAAVRARGAVASGPAFDEVQLVSKCGQAIDRRTRRADSAHRRPSGAHRHRRSSGVHFCRTDRTAAPIADGSALTPLRGRQAGRCSAASTRCRTESLCRPRAARSPHDAALRPRVHRVESGRSYPAAARRLSLTGAVARASTVRATARARPAVRPARRRRAGRGCRRAAAAAPWSGRSTGMKLVSPPQRGTTCWCRWAAMPAPATAALVHADVEAVRAADRADHPHRGLGERRQLGGLRRRRGRCSRRRAGTGRPAGARGCTGTG